MQINLWLNHSTELLEKFGVSTARLDCLVLLQDILKKDKSYLLAHPEHELTSGQLRKLASQIKRRIKHEPLAYIRGISEFYGREFKVNKHTLEPRPETETMIELLLNLHKSQKPPSVEDSLPTKGGNVNWKVVDVGTGSGCIGITVKLEIPGTKVVGIDISKKCIDIAEINAKLLRADVKFFQGNLLEPDTSASEKRTEIILANLPYVPNSHTINQAAMQEPKIAIFGGSDGLDLYRRMFDQIIEYDLKPKYIFTESLPTQHHDLTKIALSAGYKQVTRDDFIQLFERG